MPLGLDRELVLVAEDDTANRALLARLLERAGYRSIAVADGRDALHAAIEEDPDLVLLDIGLPGLNGLDVCRRLRADPRTVALPIILVTGQVTSRDVVAGLDAGADDFVRKPYDEAELMARVRSVLRLARVTAEMVGAHGVIAALANAVEAKDSTTELHCQRLAGLAHELGMRAGLEPVDAQGSRVRRAAPRHRQDRRVRRDPHQARAADGAGVARDAPAPAHRRAHLRAPRRPRRSSRRSSGTTTSAGTATGYPDGLRGEAIPIGARIVGLVDAYDAIIHDRPYRPARSVEQALEEIRREAGAQFDPELVRLFVPVVERELRDERAPGARALEALRAAV